MTTLKNRIYNYLESEAEQKNWFVSYAQIRVKFDSKSETEIKDALDKLITSGNVFDDSKHQQKERYSIVPF